jgi:hypothetical protein
MKRALFPALLLLAALSAPHDIFAADTSNDTSFIHVSFGLQGWLSQADAKWQISFPYVTQLPNPGIAAFTPGRIESRLDFKKIDSPMTIITGGMGIGPYFSFDGLIGAGSISDGRSTDTDRFVPSAGGGLQFSQSSSNINGDVRLGQLNVYFNNHRFTGKNQGPWGAVFGYTHYEDKLTMTNGVQNVSVIFDGTAFPPPGPFPPTQVLNSTFDFYWDAIKFGVLPQFEITDRLSISGMFAVYPYVSYRGEGYWNLRTGGGPDAFRSESPNFIQKSSTGYGYEALLGLTYRIAKKVELTAGYRYFFLYAENGTDTTYFANGSVAKTDLDWATVTRQGVYAEVMYKF